MKITYLKYTKILQFKNNLIINIKKNWFMLRNENISSKHFNIQSTSINKFIEIQDSTYWGTIDFFFKAVNINLLLPD